MIARAASRSRLRSDSGASVAITITHEPSPRSPGDSASRLNAYWPSSFPTGAPSTWRMPPKFVCTSTPTVHPPSAVGSTRDDVPMPPFQPNATVPVPAPTHLRRPDRSTPTSAPRARAPAGSDATECRSAFHHSSRRPPGLIERTFAMPGCSSIHPTIASAAFHTQSVHVRRIGVSSSPSSRSCVTPVILPKPLPDVERRRHAVGEQVARVRQNRRHAGADRIALDRPSSVRRARRRRR